MIFRITFNQLRRAHRYLYVFVIGVIIFVAIFGTNKDESKNLKFQYEKMMKQSWYDYNLKYILVWTPNITPFDTIRTHGQIPFLAQNCQYINCYFTHERLFNVTRFDAVLFSIAALKNHSLPLPKYRSPRQKYVAVSTEPPPKHPVINPLYDGYFNWTWTYRYQSEITFHPFHIKRTDSGKVVGPKQDMVWSKEHSPKRLDSMQKFLEYKTKGVIWIKNSCKGKSEQEKYAMDLEKELFGIKLSLSVYSNCDGYETCGTKTECDKKIRSHYFFLAFEDYFDENYVTDNLLLAIRNFAIPIVMGDADYSSFLPPGSYLDTRQYNPKEMSQKIEDCMTNFTAFVNNLEWFDYYTYEPIGPEMEICEICSALNNREIVEKESTCKDFRKFWNHKSVLSLADMLLDDFNTDTKLRDVLVRGNYSEIRKAVKDKHFAKPEDSVFVFDKASINMSSDTTNREMEIPFEFTVYTAGTENP